MKNVLAATALAATLLAGSALPSFAATTDLGQFTGSDTESFNHNRITASFTDYYTFNLATLATITKASITNSFSNAKQFISNFTVALYSGTVGKGSLIASSTINKGVDGQETTNVSGYSLGTGNYYLQVSGGIAKGGSASYGGSLAISAVPLPSTVALFGVALAGLGVAGAMRRKSAASVA